MKTFGIYADYAATARPWKKSISVMSDAMEVYYGNPSSTHSIGVDAKRAMNRASMSILDTLDAYNYQLIWTSGGTESNNFMIPIAKSQNVRKTILVSPVEHSSVLNVCNALKRDGFNVVYLPITKAGVVDVESAKCLFDDDVCFCSAMFVNNEVGSINEVKRLARLSHDCGAIFHMDAVQAIGHLNFSVQDIDADLISFSSHKFGGPNGCGGLICKPDIASPLMFGGQQNNGLRPGTEDIPSIMATASALEEQLSWLKENAIHIKEMRDAFLYTLAPLDGFVLNGFDALHYVPHIVNITVNGVDNSAIVNQLSMIGICVSSGSACNEGLEKVSHVLRAINPRSLGGIRVSFGPENTMRSAVILAEEIINIVNKLR